MPKEKGLQELFHDTLRDVYYAERKIVTALQKMKRAALAEELETAFERHREQTQGQIERLQRVFEIIGKPARGKTCEAIEGLIGETEEVIDEYNGSAALDAGLIGCAQAVEHYEISRYGTLRRWAEELGLAEAAGLLNETLKEEAETDAALTKLAERVANDRAKAGKVA
ncbi:Protein YciF [uncultured Alphaproteobacteria bacterium]|uniref:Protein YciF n=1 Tax=uncultured Alphaproteobacteria bacterium TaxID=91750 RepID=A0A212KM32_9PROT|nr:Protein YciF [uncultured Alphaproteobacteria bacterium]